MPAREADGRRVAGLPGEHVLGAPRVAVVAQWQRHHVGDAGQVAHEHEQGQRIHVSGPGGGEPGAVEHRPVATRSQAGGELPQGVQRQPGRAIAIERDAAQERARRPQRLEIKLGQHAVLSD